jgi:glyoxylase-like metal-dependent hydrolase (beta-lactamase superfamily II)
MRVLRPDRELYAFYDGRTGERFAAAPNWVDEGALALGIASYAIVDGDEALIYDTHISVAHAHRLRRTLEAAGVRTFTVVLSHWHLDHVAGTEAFADCEVIACERTAEILARDRVAIEAGRLEGPPAIRPLVLPTRTFADRLALTVGAIEVELLALDIHSDDAVVLWWPQRRLLLAGDTLEDTVTYVDMPGHFRQHLHDLERLRELAPSRILPNHGDPEIIAGGGYRGTGLIDATSAYIELLRRTPDEPALAATPLRELLAEPLAAGQITYFAAYEAVHAHNLAAVAGAGGVS